MVQFTLPLPAGTSLDSAPAVSPNGRLIAFVGKDSVGSRLFVRDLGASEATAIPGTDRALQPFWSADSNWIGFFARGKLMYALQHGLISPLPPSTNSGLT